MLTTSNPPSQSTPILAPLTSPETKLTFATAGGVATFVDSRAVSAERVVRTCHFEAPDDAAKLAAWVAASPEPGSIWESRTCYPHGTGAGLPVFRVKATSQDPAPVRLRDALTLTHDASDDDVNAELESLPCSAACDACRHDEDVDNRNHFACQDYHPAWDIAEEIGLADVVLTRYGWTWQL